MATACFRLLKMIINDNSKLGLLRERTMEKDYVFNEINVAESQGSDVAR